MDATDKSLLLLFFRKEETLSLVPYHRRLLFVTDALIVGFAEGVSAAPARIAPAAALALATHRMITAHGMRRFLRRRGERAKIRRGVPSGTENASLQACVRVTRVGAWRNALFYAARR